MELVPTKRLQLFAGRGNRELSDEIAAALDVPLGEVVLSTFANGEIYCRFGESIRGSDVFIIQSHCEPINERVMEMLIMIDAAKRASAKRITAVTPFYGYARQDRKAEGREPITARLVADLITVAGADRVVTVDLHTGQIQGFFDKPVDHLTAVPLLAEYAAKLFGAGADVTVVSPDAGGGKLMRRFSNYLAEYDIVVSCTASSLPILGKGMVERIAETDAIPLPPPLREDANELAVPGGTGLTARPSNIRRGIGWGVSIKNLMYSEGFDDFSTARCRIQNGSVSVKFATAEVGQGFVMLAQQIARTVLGVDEVLLDTIDTQVGSAGSTSASRQTWMSGGAVDAACRAVRDELLDHVASTRSLVRAELEIDGIDIVDRLTGSRIPVSSVIGEVDIDRTVEYHHPPTEDLDENGHGNCHVAFAFVAHRAVVDVDPDLGLVKVVQVATAQDVGRVLNPLSVRGQVEGGIAQGLGLAVMEEIVVTDGKVRNPSFTDYLLPTFLDAPDVDMVLIEEREPKSPLGAKGVGEPPCVSITPAIANAIRQATGRELPRVPVRPYDICL